tara:strand:- start:2784 stop:3008 length:225 start_codon:yes stop_codon:yes gene_type:complete
MSFDGGERKHHRDCVHYPESLTKMYDDALAENERLRFALREIVRMTCKGLDAPLTLDRIDETAVNALGPQEAST